MVQGLGLTTAELMLARSTAIKYAGKRDKPERLVDLMLRFGMDFLRITPLSKEHLQDLKKTCSAHWSCIFELSDAAKEEPSSSSEESEQALSVAWDPNDEIDLPGYKLLMKYLLEDHQFISSSSYCQVSPF